MLGSHCFIGEYSISHKKPGRSADLDSQTLVQYIKQPGPAPVHRWNPPFCGDMDLRIAADGIWYHNGSPIGRQAMVNLFATVLKREGDEYFLVTPVEKLRIQVEDCPFLATQLEVSGMGREQQLQFITRNGERVTAGKKHPLRVDLNAQGEPHPIIEVRSNLWALIHRNLFYRLVELAEHRPAGDTVTTGVYSGGEFFVLGQYPQSQ